MSHIEKFQMNETWRENIKKFLFMERKPETFQNNTKLTESQRYSLDIDKDLKNIIEEKQNHKKTLKIDPCIVTRNEKTLLTPKTKQLPDHKCRMDRLGSNNDKNICRKSQIEQEMTDESFVALEKICEKTISGHNSTLYKYLNGDEEPKPNNVLVWQHTSDESFEALEKMCDKTASDPNSTLFQYLHSDRKDQVLADVKKRSEDVGNTNCIREKEESLLKKFNNCTLLDDIEEPSRIWENTICDVTAVQTSPVKLVGLRPSTIIEETTDETCNSDESSQQSFETATRTTQNDVSSTTYDTAHDSISVSSRFNNSSRDQKHDLDLINVDHNILSAIAKSQKQQETNENTKNPTSDKVCGTTVELQPSNSDNSSDSILNTSNASLNLIDLERTFKPIRNSPQSSLQQDSIIDDMALTQNSHAENKSEKNYIYSLNLSDNSVIEILSDDDVEEEENVDNATSSERVITCDEIKSEISSQISYSFNQETFSLNHSLEDNKENNKALQKSIDKSIQFNDTMEEVEYMLKKGMEYMATQAALKQNSEAVNEAVQLLTEKNSIKKQPNSTLSNNKPLKNVSSPASKPKSCTNTITPAKRTTAKSQNLSSRRFDNNIVKPFPKLDLFAKPSRHARHNELSKQQKFSHVVSPIGTYMKKTAKTPLMSSLSINNGNYFNSTAIKELENESRLYHPKFAISGRESIDLPGIISGMKRPLAKKAYISSNLKHIVDERTPVTIPGGKKIQKYLENAIMPTVLRHDGKFKIPGGSVVSNKLNTQTTTSPATSNKQPLKPFDTNLTVSTGSSQIPPRSNTSLADLSLMSGDVSMYTIMDAQKF